MWGRRVIGGAGLALSAVPAVVVAVAGSGSWTAPVELGPLGTSEIGVVLDPVRAILLGLVLLVSTVVAGYVSANLVGQRGVGRFAGLQVLLAAALVLTVVSPSLVQLAVAWTATSLAVAALVGHAATAPARAASRRVLRSLLIGDAAIWASVVIAAAAVGTTDLDAVEPGSLAGVAIAALLVIGGLVRSAQVPVNRWLQETTEAPSPVSALLHAGVVNGVGVVVLIAWPLVAESWPARAIAVAAGAATIAVGWATSRVRPDVKGRLVSSTSAQMGYLAVVAGLGVPAAVLVHIVGHGLWKAALFLGAGSAVDRVRRAGAEAHAASRAAVAAAAAVAAGVVVVAGALPWPGESLLATPATLLLVAAAAFTAAVAAAGALGRGGAASALAVAGVTAAGAAYIVIVRALETALGEELPLAAAGWGEPGSWIELAVVVALAAAALAAWRLDRAASQGGAEKVVAWAARQTLPTPPLRRVPVDGAQPQDVVALEAADARAAVDVVSDVVAPLWPLHAFVASNPLAGLEVLPFRDALDAASVTWGSRAGIDAAMFRAAVRAGVVDRDVLDRICAEVAPGPDLVVNSPVRTHTELVEALLTDDALEPKVVQATRARLEQLGRWMRSVEPVRTPGERAVLADPRLADAQQRARDLVSMHAARVLGDPAWPALQGIWGSVLDDDVDRALGLDGASEVLAGLPRYAPDAIAVLAARIHAQGFEVVPVLTRLLARDPGFVAHLQWRRRVGLDVGHDRIADLLAARLAMDVVVAAAGPAELPAVQGDDELAAAVAVLVRAIGLDLAETSDDVLLALSEVADAVLLAGPEMLRLRAWEESYREPLLARIAGRAAALAEGVRTTPESPDAQVITCIDVRSEPMRRRLEELGPWETLGAAGFFGIPLRHGGPAGEVSDRLPALLLPDRQVAETGTCSVGAGAGSSVEHAAHAPDHVGGAAFALADAAGWAAGPWAVLRTFAPRTADRLAHRWQRSHRPEATELQVEGDELSPLGFSLDELADRAQAFLAVCGLDRPAPLVLLLGHGAHVTNQPHIAAYDCGACGGNPGDVSARTMALVLNDSRVRDLLAERGVIIPGDTVFAAALHGTTDATVDVLSDVPAAVQPVLDRVVADLRQALADGTDVGLQSTRAADWAQARPEWGLARNAALIIGPRSLTAKLDLDGRTFLHSYRADLDADGSSLEFLLTAPMVVAQWISSQYWSTTVDPERFGAGDKTLHNIVCRPDSGPSPLTGVLVGARGDLRIGIPWQAVSESAPVDGAWTALPHHEPLRLLVVVAAERASIDAILARREEAARLVAGEWVTLVAVDPVTGGLQQRLPDGAWADVAPEPASDDRVTA